MVGSKKFFTPAKIRGSSEWVNGVHTVNEMLKMHIKLILIKRSV